MTEDLYKITGPDGSSCHGGTGKWRLNRWRGVRGRLVPCRNGIHLCRAQDLPRWVANGTLWRCEVDGEQIVHKDCKVVVRRAQPVERIGPLDDRNLRLFAVWCVRNTQLPGNRVVWDLLTRGGSQHDPCLPE